MKFEFFDHTADVKFKAYGKNLEEAFVNAALATTFIMTKDKIAKKIKKEININAKNKEALLFDYFDEMIFLLDTEGFLVGDVEDIRITLGNAYNLTCTFVGDSGDNYDVHTYIKAPTYSDMKIEEKKGQVVIQAVHDI